MGNFHERNLMQLWPWMPILGSTPWLAVHVTYTNEAPVCLFRPNWISVRSTLRDSLRQMDMSSFYIVHRVCTPQLSRPRSLVFKLAFIVRTSLTRRPSTTWRCTFPSSRDALLILCGSNEAGISCNPYSRISSWLRSKYPCAANTLRTEPHTQ